MLRTKTLRNSGALFGAVLLLIPQVTAVSAQPAACGPRPDVLAWLEATHAEQPVSYGVVGNSHVLEIHASESGNWTALITSAIGVSCIVAAGHSWTSLTPPPSGADAQDTADRN